MSPLVEVTSAGPAQHASVGAITLRVLPAFGGPTTIAAQSGGVRSAPPVVCPAHTCLPVVDPALLSPASADESVRHGEHFAIAARALLAPLFHAAALSGGGIDRARGWLGRSEFSQPAEILRGAGAQIALEELSGVAAQAVGDYRTSVLGTAQVALAWASRAAVRASTDPALTPQIDLGELIAQQGTLYVVSPSRIQQELAPLIAALLDGLCAHAIDLAITSPAGRLQDPLLLALDEVANIAPIRSLPRLLSEGIQQGIVPVLGLQDMSQARALGRARDRDDVVHAGAAARARRGRRPLHRAARLGRLR